MQEGLASELQRRCAAREAELADERQRAARLAEELAAARKELESARAAAVRAIRADAPPAPSRGGSLTSSASGGGGGVSSEAGTPSAEGELASLREAELAAAQAGGPLVHLEVTIHGGNGAYAAGGLETERSLLACELRALENEHEALVQRHGVLAGAVRVAMSCLPPPAKPSSAARTPSEPAGTREEGEGGDRPETSVDLPRAGALRDEASASRLAAERLVSSARQAAHANARLGNVMATERDARRAANDLAGRRCVWPHAPHA